MIATEGIKTRNPGTEAVKKLRMDSLKNGIPFMINSKELPSRQCYMEYPDGTIKIEGLPAGSSSFITISILSKIEGRELRKKFDLVDYA